MDKMREGFEAWFWDYHHKDCTKDYWHVVFDIGCDGKYQGIACEGAWQGWQASRAALRSDLMTEHGKYRDEMVAGFDDVEFAISLDMAGASRKQPK